MRANTSYYGGPWDDHEPTTFVCENCGEIWPLINMEEWGLCPECYNNGVEDDEV